MDRVNNPVHCDVDQLVDLTGAILELTADMATLARVPEVLSRGLDLGPLGIALVDVLADTGPAIRTLEVYAGASSGAELTPESDLRQVILDYCRIDDQGQSHHSQEKYPYACSVHGVDGSWNQATNSGTKTILARHVDAQHRLIVMIAHPAPDTALPPATLESLNLIMDHLAKSLRILVNNLSYPPRQGAPFTSLTEREWTVLCSLNSEAGEKQIADSLGLSPHTLHSHVKSIYRKLGVQGRLPLLQKFRRALQDYRLGLLCTRRAADHAEVQYVAV